MSSVRVGTVQRDEAADRINEAAVAGYLDEEEREARISAALTAKYADQLDLVVKELPARIERTALVSEPAPDDDLTRGQAAVALAFTLIVVVVLGFLFTAIGHMVVHRNGNSFNEMLNSQPLPDFQQIQCTAFPAGFAVVFDPAINPGENIPVQALNIIGGQECAVTGEPAPLPITLMGADGQPHIFPGDNNVITAPLGSHWDYKTQEIATK